MKKNEETADILCPIGVHYSVSELPNYTDVTFDMLVSLADRLSRVCVYVCACVYEEIKR